MYKYGAQKLNSCSKNNQNQWCTNGLKLCKYTTEHLQAQKCNFSKQQMSTVIPLMTRKQQLIHSAVTRHF